MCILPTFLHRKYLRTASCNVRELSRGENCSCLLARIPRKPLCERLTLPRLHSCVYNALFLENYQLRAANGRLRSFTYIKTTRSSELTSRLSALSQFKPVTAISSPHMYRPARTETFAVNTSRNFNKQYRLSLLQTVTLSLQQWQHIFYRLTLENNKSRQSMPNISVHFYLAYR